MKKIIGIFILFLLICPITSVFGESPDYQIQDKERIEKNDLIDDVISMINQVDENIIRDYLEDFVSFGGKKTGTKNCRLTAEYIYDKFQSFGLYAYFDNWIFPRYKFRHKALMIDRNVVAIHSGTDVSSDAVIIISAHYDTIAKDAESPGANDDGSGVVAMLSIAEIISQYSFNFTIKFIAVSGEEQGAFGSFYDAKKSYKNDDDIIAVLNIDTVGHVNNSKDGNFVQVFCHERSKWLVNYANNVNEKYEEYIGLLSQYSMQYPVDHESYNDYGYDGIQFVEPKPELNHWLHSPEDTIEHINFTYLEKVTKLVLAITVELASVPFPVRVRIITPYEGRVYLFGLPVFKTPGFNFIFTRIRGLTYLFGKAKATVNITTNDDINSVYFGIDGYWIHISVKPPYEWRIGKRMYPLPIPFKIRGFHRLTVCVTTNSGHYAYDEMDIFIMKL